MQFALLRIAELLDDAAPGRVSAALSVDSQTAVDELAERLSSYRDAGTRYSYPQVERAVADTTSVLRRDPTLRPLDEDGFDALLGDLRTAEAIRKAHLPVSGRRSRFDLLLDERLLSSLSRLAAALDGPPGYRAHVRSRVLATLGRNELTHREWNRFDGDIGRLCAGLLAEGRDGPSVVFELAAALRGADVEDAWAKILIGRRRRFEVVVFVDGMRSRQRPGGDGLLDLHPDRLHWAGGTRASHMKLTRLARSAVAGARYGAPHRCDGCGCRAGASSGVGES